MVTGVFWKDFRHRSDAGPSLRDQHLPPPTPPLQALFTEESAPTSSIILAVVQRCAKERKDGSRMLLGCSGMGWGSAAMGLPIACKHPLLRGCSDSTRKSMNWQEDVVQKLPSWLTRTLAKGEKRAVGRKRVVTQSFSRVQYTC